MITMLTIKMKVNEELTVYFNPPLLHVKEIQLNDVWNHEPEKNNPTKSYLIFCDIIDSSFSLVNFVNKTNVLAQSKLLGLFGVFPLRDVNIILPVHNKKELTNLTLSIKYIDMTTPIKPNVVILNFKIFPY